MIIALLVYTVLSPTLSIAGEINQQASTQKWQPEPAMGKDVNPLVYVLGGIAVAAVIVAVIVFSSRGNARNATST